MLINFPDTAFLPCALKRQFRFSAGALLILTIALRACEDASRQLLRTQEWRVACGFTAEISVVNRSTKPQPFGRGFGSQKLKTLARYLVARLRTRSLRECGSSCGLFKAQQNYFLPSSLSFRSESAE
jgi:hypothetical protein